MKRSDDIFGKEYISDHGMSLIPDVYRGREDDYIDPRKDPYGLIGAANQLSLARPRRVTVAIKIKI